MINLIIEDEAYKDEVQKAKIKEIFNFLDDKYSLPKGFSLRLTKNYIETLNIIKEDIEESNEGEDCNLSFYNQDVFYLDSKINYGVYNDYFNKVDEIVKNQVEKIRLANELVIFDSNK